MDLELAHEIVDRVNAQVGGNADVVEDYSGRGMMGDTTTGINCRDMITVSLVYFHLGFAGGPSPGEVRQDHFGKGYILY